MRQVEELASLVKDNLPCKHLVLSVEEVLINFLQTDTSSDGVLELEPMNSYNRLLLHRLADIFGFSHESVGEGDDRHLILERCPETSIPSILVSDILWQYDDPQSSAMTHQLLKRTETSPVLKTKSPSVQHSLEEREAAYLAARQRIFSMDLGEEKEPVKQKPRSVPVVARRMIAHALGQRISSINQDTALKDFSGSGEETDEMKAQDKDKIDLNLTQKTFQESFSLSGTNTKSYDEVKKNEQSTCASSQSEWKAPQKQAEKVSSSVSISRSGRDRNNVNEDHHKRQHLGAAKRMFAHALGMQSGKESFLSKCSEINHTNME
ncbi:hypothetical protein FEM48_Zijuj02G0183700 [Ziziphus jujuba var. spinosa]|uniref:R3H domain-containing protein 2 n=1 Tax=Ziziphus jujuba var. spinosa TaxID=714518 RepID=A0A978VX90_ZIZJJ|nr:hypothetical protein FEM48_Zijuj02G0183700 [Ziziphus jujuba var. spinosa]